MAHNVTQSILNKARADKFILVLSTPNALKDKADKTDRRVNRKSVSKVIPDTMQFSVYGTVVPNVTVPAQEQHFSGQTLKVSSHDRPAYGDVEVNFTIDNEYNNYWYIWRWLDVMNDSETSVYDRHNDNPPTHQVDGEPIPSPDLLMDYQTDVSIFGLDDFNKKQVEFKYTKAFPTELGNISFSHRETGELESTFTFSFSQLIVNLL
jgi:hypothetical protein